MSHEHPFRNRHQNGTVNPYRSAVHAQKTSALAILSVISGLLSFPMMCLLVLSLPFSIFAIVSGHMARGVVKDGNGEYSGLEMATFGMILGYFSLAIMGGLLMVWVLASSPSGSNVIISRGSRAQANNVLLEEATSQLLAGTEEATFGVSTSDENAQALAQHYVDTLHLLDKTHFQETDESADIAPREYRAYVRLNEDSAAFLLLVPEYERFTDAAKGTLHESCWMIGQRSVDDILPRKSDLAVAIYSASGCERVMTGVTKADGGAEAGLKKKRASENSLASFFRLAERKSTPVADATAEQVESQIDNRSDLGSSLPAEVE